MKIKRARISGYSAFRGTDWIDFAPTMNIVSGKNNSGKSSLLKAISREQLENAHKNPKNFLKGALPIPTVEIEFQTSVFEFAKRLQLLGTQVNVVGGGPTVADHDELKKIFETDRELTLSAKKEAGRPLAAKAPLLPQSQSSRSMGRGPYQSNIQFVGGELQVSGGGSGNSEGSAKAYFHDSPVIFHFPAERYHKSRVGYGRFEDLAGDASNLAGYLQFLQGNHVALYEEIVDRLCQIIPTIEGISIDTLTDGFEVLVWPKGADGNRDLAVPLSSCGSGVSQILAIFSCVATRRDAIILVDEINSFLHPLAVKDLLSTLFADYPTHQYVISSHSSEVLSHPSVERILNVEVGEFQSSVLSFDRDDVDELRASLRKLGVTMSDVLGADYFLWVEGPTEVIAIPSIYRKHRGRFPPEIRVAAVDATGDFSKKKSDHRTVVRLYEHVSKYSAPLSRGQAFLLDREGYPEEIVASLRKSTDEKLNVIGRRCIENYALDVQAIAKVLSGEVDGESFSDDQVRAALVAAASNDDVAGSQKFSGDLHEKAWLSEADGAKILKMAFASVTENRVEFRKVAHTPRILALRPKEGIEELLESVDERLRFLGLMGE